MKTVICVSESCEGGDYFECVLEVPAGFDLDAERKIWRKWYDEEYCIKYDGPGIRRATAVQVRFRSLLDQLLANGCRIVEMEIWYL